MFSIFALAVSAHFRLLSPISRGFDEATEGIAPCGNFNESSATKTPILPKGNITLEIADSNATVKLFAGLNSTAMPIAIGGGNFTTVGNYSLSYDLSSAISSGLLKSGTPVAIQVQLSGGDGLLFQCADVTLTDRISTTTTSATATSTVSATATAVSTPRVSTTSAAPSATASVKNSDARAGVALLSLIALLA